MRVLMFVAVAAALVLGAAPAAAQSLACNDGQGKSVVYEYGPVQGQPAKLTIVALACLDGPNVYRVNGLKASFPSVDALLDALVAFRKINVLKLSDDEVRQALAFFKQKEQPGEK